MKLLACSCPNPSKQQTNKMHRRYKNSATFAKATITTQNVLQKNPKTTQERHKAYSFAVRA
jgi:hypothetical protein